MAEEGDIAHLTYELLERMNARLERMEDDIPDIKSRLSAVEASVAQHSVQFVALNARMDRFDERLKRIGRRLDLTDA